MQLAELVSFLSTKVAPEQYHTIGDIYGPHFGTFYGSKEIKKVLLTPDLNLNAIHFAMLNKIGLVISFFGLIKNPIDRFPKELVDKFTILTRYPVLIYVLGPAFISAENGVSDAAITSFRPLIEKENVINIKGATDVKIPLGRMCRPFRLTENFREEVKFGDLLEAAKNAYSGSIGAYSNNYEKKINKVAVFGTDLDFVEKDGEIRWNEYDCVIAGAISTPIMLLFRDLDVSILSIPLLEVIDMALSKLHGILSLEFSNDEFFLYEPTKWNQNARRADKKEKTYNGGLNEHV